jgi:hypothetical protein
VEVSLRAKFASKKTSKNCSEFSAQPTMKCSHTRNEKLFNQNYASHNSQPFTLIFSLLDMLRPSQSYELSRAVDVNDVNILALMCRHARFNSALFERIANAMWGLSGMISADHT